MRAVAFAIAPFVLGTLTLIACSSDDEAPAPSKEGGECGRRSDPGSPSGSAPARELLCEQGLVCIEDRACGVPGKSYMRCADEEETSGRSCTCRTDKVPFSETSIARDEYDRQYAAPCGAPPEGFSPHCCSSEKEGLCFCVFNRWRCEEVSTICRCYLHGELPSVAAPKVACGKTAERKHCCFVPRDDTNDPGDGVCTCDARACTGKEREVESCEVEPEGAFFGCGPGDYKKVEACRAL